MEDRKFIVTDAEGNEKEMYIMFTTKLEETQEQRLEKFIEIQKELIRLSKEMLKRINQLVTFKRH